MHWAQDPIHVTLWQRLTWYSGWSILIETCDNVHYPSLRQFIDQPEAFIQPQKAIPSVI